MGEQKVTKSFEELSENVSVIAKPLATEKLVKKLAKLLAAASGRRTCTRRGVKEVVKAVRKGSKGWVNMFTENLHLNHRLSLSTE